MASASSSGLPGVVAKKARYEDEAAATETKTAFFRTHITFRRQEGFGKPEAGYIKATVYFISKKDEDAEFGEIEMLKKYPLSESYHARSRPKKISFCGMMDPTCNDRSSMLCLQDQFELGSACFIDIDLQASVRIIKIELEEAFHFGRVCRITTGLRCNVFHSHRTDEQWIPSWTESYKPAQVGAPSGAGLVPQKTLYMVPLAKIKRANTIRVEFTKKELDCWVPELLLTVTITPELEGPIVSFRKDAEKTVEEKQEFCEKLDIEFFSSDLWLEIVKFLPFDDRLKAILALSATSRRLRAIFRHPSFYQTIDLKAFSPLYLSDAVLNFLAERSSQFRHFRISWLCHLPEGVDFSKFLRRIPQTMVSFVAEACPVVDDKILRTVVGTQPNLETLDLSACFAISPEAFGYISSLMKLRRLSLHSTSVSFTALMKIVEHCSKLEVLNLGLVELSQECNPLKAKFDDVCSKIAEKLGSTFLKAIYLSFTKLTNKCLVEEVLPKCSRLEELYLGQFVSPGEWNPDTYSVMAVSCPRLRRLALVRVHTIAKFQNPDVSSFAEQLTKLEHLIVIPAETTVQAWSHLLDSCSYLNHLVIADYNTTSAAVAAIREDYSRCKIDHCKLGSTEEDDEARRRTLREWAPAWVPPMCGCSWDSFDSWDFDSGWNDDGMYWEGWGEYDIEDDEGASYDGSEDVEEESDGDEEASDGRNEDVDEESDNDEGDEEESCDDEGAGGDDSESAEEAG